MIRWLSQTIVPVATILVFLVVVWYAAAIPMNANRTYMMAADDAEISFNELVVDTWPQKKPQLPLPHQKNIRCAITGITFPTFLLMVLSLSAYHASSTCMSRCCV